MEGQVLNDMVLLKCWAITWVCAGPDDETQWNRQSSAIDINISRWQTRFTRKLRVYWLYIRYWNINWCSRNEVAPRLIYPLGLAFAKLFGSGWNAKQNNPIGEGDAKEIRKSNIPNFDCNLFNIFLLLEHTIIPPS